ncbi:MAG: hypothetical protein J3R72DRAFT_353923, partial [Linnemannia gamsii]
SSASSHLEAFSYNPTEDSFALLPAQAGQNTTHLNECNPTLTEFWFSMMGRADTDGSKSNTTMNAWLP